MEHDTFELQNAANPVEMAAFCFKTAQIDANSRTIGHNMDLKKNEGGKKNICIYIYIIPQTIPDISFAAPVIKDHPTCALRGGLVVHQGGRSAHGGLEGSLPRAPNFAAAK